MDLHGTIVTDQAFAIYDAPTWIFSILSSRLHIEWTRAVGGQLETRYFLDCISSGKRPLNDGPAGLRVVKMLERADAVSVGGQQHGMVLLDAQGEVVRDALLWNDTRSAPQAAALIEEMGGPEASVAEIGSLMVASFTASKLRWVRDEEPENAQRAASVLLPHDYVSRHLAGGGEAFTDRGDASGTAYYSTRT